MISVPHIGRRIEYINDPALPSKAFAKERAVYELRRTSFMNNNCTLTVPYNFTLMVNNLITVTDSFYGFVRERFIIKEISYGIGSDNQVTIVCSNVIRYDRGGIE